MVLTPDYSAFFTNDSLAKNKYFGILKALLKTDLINYANKIEKDTYEKLAYEKFEFLELFIKKNFFSKELLNAPLNAGIFKGVSTIWLIVNLNKYDLFEVLLKNDLVDKKSLEDASNNQENSIFKLVRAMKNELLEEILEKGLLTSEALQATSKRPVVKGMNSVWLLVYKKQYELLNKMLNKDLITRKSLEATAGSGLVKGLNSIYCLVRTGDLAAFELLKQMLKRNLLTQKSLKSKVLIEDKYDDSIMMLARAKQYDLLNEMVSKELLAEEDLIAAGVPDEKINKTSPLQKRKFIDLESKLKEEAELNSRKREEKRREKIKEKKGFLLTKALKIRMRVRQVDPKKIVKINYRLKNKASAVKTCLTSKLRD